MPIGTGVDGTAAFRDLGFASLPRWIADGGRRKANSPTWSTVKTADGARTMGLDPERREILLPMAEMTIGVNGRSTAKPGIFEILVVGQP